MIALILAAGKGTRLRPLSYFIPKILLPVRGEPVLSHLLANLEGIELETIYIVASENIEIINNYLEKTNQDNVKVIKGLGWETGGDLSLAIEEANITEDLIVMNGDLITDIKIKELVETHKADKNHCTISVFELNDPEEAKRFGSIEKNGDNMITKFSEKKDSNIKIPALVNTGFYVIGDKILSDRSKYFIPRKFRLETEFFPALAKEGKLKGVISEVTYWWDVGTIESYLNAENYMINKKGVVPP